MIRRARISEVQAIARLHRQSLGATASSRVGQAYMEWLYGVMVMAPASRVWVEVERGVIRGVAAATESLQATEESLRKARGLWVWGLIAKAIMRDPRIGWELWRRQRSLRGLRPEQRERPWLLTLAVAPPAQRRGIGGKLLSRVICPGMMVETEVETVRFYQKHGLIPVRQNGGTITLEYPT